MKRWGKVLEQRGTGQRVEVVPQRTLEVYSGQVATQETPRLAVLLPVLEGRKEKTGRMELAGRVRQLAR